jgi:hypothetical protein
MKTLIIKLLLLTSLVLGISFAAGFVFSKKELLRSYNMYLLEEDVDILFVGSSHVFTSINTDVLDKNTYSNNFILATPSQNISQSYYLIKEFIEQKTPKVIFLETYSFKDYIGNDFVNHAAYDGLKLSMNKIQAAKEASFNDSITSLSRFTNLVIPFYKYHNRWNGEITENDFNYFDKLQLNKGSEIPTGKNKFKETEVDFIDHSLGAITEEKPLPINIDNKLSEIINLCKSNNIKLVLFSTPYLAHHGFSVQDEVKTMNFIKEKYGQDGIYYLDLNTKYKDLGISYEDFKDNHHLNSRGTEKVNDHIVTWINSNLKHSIPNRQSERIWYKYLNHQIPDNQILFEKVANFTTHENVVIEKIAFVTDQNGQYIIVDVNDDIENASIFNDDSSEYLRMMVHLYPKKEDHSKFLDSNNKFLNQDFKPTVINLEGNKVLYAKLKVLTTSTLTHYNWGNFTFYNNKGRGNILTIHDLILD